MPGRVRLLRRPAPRGYFGSIDEAPAAIALVGLFATIKSIGIAGAEAAPLLPEAPEILRN